MSEPVGNSPRAPGDIPGNSHRERETRVPAEKETREPVEKIIEGKVVTRKTPWYKRLGRNLIANDAQSIGDFIWMDVVIPAIRNLIRDTIVGGVDQTLYGSSRLRRREIGEPRSSLRTRYDRMSEREGEPRRMLSREARARHDFDDVVLTDRPEAIGVIEALLDRCDRYGSVSVADLYDLVGVTGSYADRNWGWTMTDLRRADVRQTRLGYLLDLPQPELLR